eukprot:gnl/MRDRNA2_/MRDRNA2_140897_c0_seq1.p1 gnl/MRDRNA2_/MRDRNA2_140897_c0~~gnl/MRDRNA2_/MRDRNA2_140897_c0_seq1.p1  ORF type:complete len:173 (+),score=39.32 gnl/MRDRNA2_/MRDRNA2_140897_c0_seq1:307-825(+)
MTTENANLTNEDWKGPWPLKWGQRVDQLYGPAVTKNIKDLGKSVGYNFNFEAVSSNTFDSHRALLWAEAQGVGVEYGKALARRYFEEGQILSDHNILVACAGEVGLAEDEARRFLASDGMAADVLERYEAVKRQGISSIPLFVLEIDGRQKAVHGSASSKEFESVIRQLLSR